MSGTPPIKTNQQFSRLWLTNGCLAAGVLMLLIAIPACDGPPDKPAPSSTPPNLPPANLPPANLPPPPPVDQSFAGVYRSATGRTGYAVNPGKKRFSFRTTIGTELLLQTEIAPYEVRSANPSGTVIEISGPDRQAGGGPFTLFRLTKLSDGGVKLERVKPVGGDLGTFHAVP